jgi:hypothetical protein
MGAGYQPFASAWLEGEGAIAVKHSNQIPEGKGYWGSDL